MTDSESLPIEKVPIRTKISEAAIWGLVFGLLSPFLLVIGAIPAIGLGIAALVNIRRSQRQLKGKTMAIVAILLGALGLFATIQPQGCGGLTERGKMMDDISNVKNLITGCRLYADDFDGEFPEKLWDLYPEYLDLEKIFKVYNYETKKSEDYIYIAGRTEKEDNKNLPVIASPVVRKGMRVVGFNGGHVNGIRESDYQKLTQSLIQRNSLKEK